MPELDPKLKKVLDRYENYLMQQHEFLSTYTRMIEESPLGTVPHDWTYKLKTLFPPSETETMWTYYRAVRLMEEVLDDLDLTEARERRREKVEERFPKLARALAA